ncbi:hypothetical protein GOP47_0020747 [Adiantum capillus-veneris]|uniref:non-specific serine/threonine protein kinase n=1 Tax=Adiantum capillus-veneris TaxID=13818 RepID=A0A9D4UAI8_ADICA|nr:hypothetical protein GOP47_0020747 [Adiantum capillus-veneris]
MGNCFGAQVQHVSGLSSVNSAQQASLATLKSAGSGGGIPWEGPQPHGPQDNGGSQEMRQVSASPGLPETGSSGGATSAHYLHPFTYADLKSATRNFRPDSLLGEGGFGSVFKGNIDERTFQPVRAGQGLLIAVKKLNPEGFQGHNEWLAELKFLGTLHHPNLVKLIGYCYEDDHRLLVYEFLSRGSLENHLFGRSRHTLSWANRLKIAIDAARGLTFLHDAQKPVIYRDFKTSNILLDAAFNAKLSDFGLAKDGPTGDKTHVTTRVMGTYGYAAPEYVATGRLTAKSDVYGFGVVLLEILTGKRAVDKNRAGGEQNLVEWATPYLADKRKWSRVLDQRLDGQYSLKGAQKAASLALQCLCQDPKLRPTMKEVLESLEPLLNPKELPKNLPSSTTTQIASSRPRHHPAVPSQDRKVAQTAQQEQKLIFYPKPSSNAFRLPSPQHIAAGKQGSDNVSPYRSPLRVSPMVRQ